jgi:hypothetical protein
MQFRYLLIDLFPAYNCLLTLLANKMTLIKRLVFNRSTNILLDSIFTRKKAIKTSISTVANSSGNNTSQNYDFAECFYESRKNDSYGIEYYKRSARIYDERCWFCKSNIDGSVCESISLQTCRY